MPENSVITNKQRSALRLIGEYLANHELPPSVRELTTHLRLSSTAQTSHYLDKLQSLGFLTKGENAARSIRLTEKGWNLIDPDRSLQIGSKAIVVLERARNGNSPRVISVPYTLVKDYASAVALEVGENEAPDDALICTGDVIIVSEERNANLNLYALERHDDYSYAIASHTPSERWRRIGGLLSVMREVD